MTQEEIIELARRAGFRVGPSRDGPDDVWGVGADLERFAKLVAEKAFQDGYSIGEAAGFKQAIKLERARGEA